MNYILKKGRLAEALNALGNGNAVYIPVKNKRGLVEYKEMGKAASADEADLSGKPDSPPKAILFPQTETLLTFKKEEGKFVITPADPDDREKIIFGVRPCDANGIGLMDQVFLEGKFVDPYYDARRAKTSIVSIACDGPTDPTCFCPSVGGSPVSTKGSDVLLYDLGDSYFVEVLTDRGRNILSPIQGLLVKPNTEQEKRKNEIILNGKNTEVFARKIAEEDIRKLDASFDSKYWEEISKKCLSCGACTYYCPTCHCFDITDEAGGKRVRTWDSCQFCTFTIHTSGHNPRTGKTQKLRNRYYHKFKYSRDNLGRYLCVGCGRCIALCPADMDITKVVSEVKA